MLAGDFSLIASPPVQQRPRHHAGRAVCRQYDLAGAVLAGGAEHHLARCRSAPIPAAASPSTARTTAPRRSWSAAPITSGRPNHSLFGRVEIADFDSVHDYDGKNPLTVRQLAAREHGEVVGVRRLAGDGVEYGELHPRHLQRHENLQARRAADGFQGRRHPLDGAPAWIHPRRRRRRLQPRRHRPRVDADQGVSVQRRPEPGAGQPPVRRGGEHHSRRVARCDLSAGRRQLPVHRAGRRDLASRTSCSGAPTASRWAASPTPSFTTTTSGRTCRTHGA